MDGGPTRPGLFAHLWFPAPEQPVGAYQVVALTIRAAGIVLVASALYPLFDFLSKGGGLLPLHGASLQPSMGWVFLAIILMAVLATVGWAAAMSYFASYTLFHWAKMDAEERTHSAYLGAWLLLMGGAQALLGLVALAHGKLSSPTGTYVLALAQSFLGIALLVARMLPTAKSVFRPPPSLHALFEA